MTEAGEGQNVDLNQLLFAAPLLLEKGAGCAEAGVVDQQVDLLVRQFQLLQQAGYLQRLAKVAGAEQHLDAEALGQLVGDALQGVALAGHQNQVAATAGQGFGNGQANPAGGAGNQGITGHG